MKRSPKAGKTKSRTVSSFLSERLKSKDTGNNDFDFLEESTKKRPKRLLTKSASSKKGNLADSDSAKGEKHQKRSEKKTDSAVAIERKGAIALKKESILVKDSAANEDALKKIDSIDFGNDADRKKQTAPNDKAINQNSEPPRNFFVVTNEQKKLVSSFFIEKIKRGIFSQRECQILIALLDHVNFDESIPIEISYQEISWATGIHLPHISKALKSLTEKGHLIREKNGGNKNAYKILTTN
ncbi:MAG: hypothetical protein ACO349_08630 [Flavobacteriaceae bacterium]